MPDEVALAARNNAAWCAAMCRAHGLASTFAPDAWTSAARTPPLYPDAVTLVPAVDERDLLDRVDSGPGCSVKDSFASLDLSSHGWRVLFHASWIIRRPGPVPAPVTDIVWEAVTDASSLSAWERAWRGDDHPAELFRPELLDEDVVVLAARAEDHVVAGAVLNRSDGAVGISNVFSGSNPREDPWPGCLAAAATLFPGTVLIGYESGGALRTACGLGFEPVGPLRVWMRDARHEPPGERC